MTFSNEWMEMRRRLLPPEERGRSATDLRAAALRRWLRSCAADPSCSVAEAARRVSEERPPEPSLGWLELREDLLGGEDAPSPDHPEQPTKERAAERRLVWRAPAAPPARACR